MPPGKVILLNGTTSSGKSALARALQGVLDEPYLHADADAIKEMSSQIPPAERAAPFARALFMPALYAAVPSCFAALVSFGSNLIIDDVARPLQLRNYAEAFSRYEVILVGVHCSEEELERRERERGNRRIGQAKEQLRQGLVHALGIYDIEVDTTHRTVEACASEIKQYRERGISPTAFKHIANLPLKPLWRMTDAVDRSIYQANHALPHAYNSPKAR